MHSKTTIIDGEEAIVGSANLNGRSLRWDTETAVHWRDTKTVRELQTKLWDPHFGETTDLDAPDPHRRWSARAEENVVLPPGQRKGFIMPYNLEAAAKTAKFRFWVPTNMV